MELVTCRQVYAAAMLLVLASGAPVHLRAFSNSSAPQVKASLIPDAGSDMSIWQQKVTTMFARLYEEREDADDEGAEQSKDAQGPIRVEVPEKELKSLVKDLTTQCERQFSAIIKGKGPAIHTYGAPGTDSSAEGCTKLDGSLCSMSANVVQHGNAGGRSMSSTTSARGTGCVPSKCMAGSDLEVLANFLHLKAKSALPGVNVNLQLSVDCTRAGGSTVEVGSATALKEISETATATESASEHAVADKGASEHAVADKGGKPPRLVRTGAKAQVPGVFIVFMALMSFCSS
jgi:hypothetical protein